jgi:hypothetical protein
MSKPKGIYIDGYEFYFWNYEPQTNMKYLITGIDILQWNVSKKV